MSLKDFRLEYSQPWLGRPFVLGDESIAWGRYVITDSTLATATIEKPSHLKLIIKEADPEQFASEFQHLIHVYCPDTFPDFFRETQALEKYHYAKERIKALLRQGCAPEDYYQANIAIVSAFDEALSAVFESSIPLHGLSRLNYVRYCQRLHGMHLTIYGDEKQTYEVAFTRDLVLASIRRESDWKRIWPQSV